MSLFSVFIHQNTKSTTYRFNIYNILEELPKTFLKIFLIDIDRLTLRIRPQNVIFDNIFKNAFLCRCFFNIGYK